MLVLEQQGEKHGKAERVACEYEPTSLPARYDIGSLGQTEHITVDHPLRHQHARRSTKAVRHHHEQSLRSTADARVRVLIDEQRAADVEEVEGDTIDNHRKDDEDKSVAGIADGKEPEAKHPGKHGNEDDLLDAQATHTKWDEQEAERFAHLRERGEDDAVLYHEGIGVAVFQSRSPSLKVGRGVAVGDMKADTHEHGEEEENGHLTVPEERKSPKSQSIHKAFLPVALADGTGGHRQGIGRHEQAQDARHGKLVGRGLEAQEVHRPHGTDEAHRSPYADGRKGLDGVETGAVQCRKGHGICQSNGGHEEGYAERVEGKEKGEADIAGSRQSVAAGEQHEKSSHEVAEAQQPLGGNPLVGHDAHQCGHEERDEALRTVEPTDVSAHSLTAEIKPHGNEIGTPNGELKET